MHQAFGLARFWACGHQAARTSWIAALQARVHARLDARAPRPPLPNARSLLDRICASGPGARIVNTSSPAEAFGAVDLSDIKGSRLGTSGMPAYGRSKVRAAQLAGATVVHATPRPCAYMTLSKSLRPWRHCHE